MTWRPDIIRLFFYYDYARDCFIFYHLYTCLPNGGYEFDLDRFLEDENELIFNMPFESEERS